ncbi:MAG TPA: DUF6516 family protein [Candidatus Brocadiales bacterium]|nr:DUF6516 family protein [Candidatus Brocadiales bacterium]
MPSIDDLRKIAEVEFADIVKDTLIIDHKLRIFLIDKGFIDVNLSQRLPDKFGFHWEVMDSAGSIFRYDNFPDKNWSNISTYPYHFHNGLQMTVESSPFPLTVIEGFRAFLEFVRVKITTGSQPV